MTRFLMKISLAVILLLILACSKNAQFVKQKQIQLSSPIIESDSTFFSKDLEVKLGLDLDDIQIRYTLDGSEPTKSSNLYSNKLLLNKSTIIKARAFHFDYLPSESTYSQFISVNNSNLIKNIELNRKPHESYQGAGILGLMDYEKGTTDYKGNEWLGFAGGDLEMEIEVIDNELVRSILLSLLSSQEAWIFLPERVELYIASKDKNYSLIATENIIATGEKSDSELRFVELKFPEQKVAFVKLILKNIKEIPVWHPGKGTAPWLFIDEVILK